MSASVIRRRIPLRAALRSATLLGLAFDCPSTLAAPAIVPIRISAASGGSATPRWQPGRNTLELLAGAIDGQLAFAWNSANDVAVAVSPDGGLSWETSQTVGTGALTGLSIIAGGTVDVSWTRDSFCRGCEMFHRRSSDGGRTFGPEHVIGIGYEGDSLVGASDGSLLAVLRDLSGPYIRSSHDGGVTWSSPVALALPSSALTALWLNPSQALVCGLSVGARWRCARSDDGGLTFGAPLGVAPSSIPAEARLLAFGPGFAGFAWADAYGAHLVRSSDAGDTWSTPLPISLAANPAALFSAQAGDEIWALIGGTGTVQLLQSVDGMFWKTSAVPGAFTCSDAAPGLVSLGHGRARVGGFFGWSTVDGGATWQGPVSVNESKLPIQGARLLRQPSGRLIALSLEGGGAESWILARVSDDNGLSWSAPVTANDVAEISNVRWPDTDASVRWHAVATREGPVYIVWVAEDADGCTSLRAARSDDGLTWQPGARVAAIDKGFAPRIAGAGAQRAVVLLVSGTPLPLASSSVDGGVTWSALAPIVTNPQFFDQQVSPELVTAADGSVLFTSASWGAPGDFELLAWRSNDAGATWRGSIINKFDADVWILDGPEVVAAGERLVAGGWPAGRQGFRWTSFQSWDRGVTWTPLPALSEHACAGGEDGGLIVDQRLVPNETQLAYISPNGDRFELGALPASEWSYSAVYLGPYEAGVLFGVNDGIPGLFYARAGFGAPVPMRRDDSLRTLTPRPNLSAIFPLAPYPTATAFPAMSDPDIAVLRDAARPLVYYQLGFPTLLPLRLVRDQDEIRLFW